MENTAYTKKLEDVIKQMLTPLKGIPLKLVIEHMTGHKVIPVDLSNADDSRVIDDLKKAAAEAGMKFNEKGKERERPNEAGNDIELFVKDALNQLGYSAKSPLTQSGKGKIMGYPDIEFTDAKGRVNYLECKTFNSKNEGSRQRSFYFSPSGDFKITEDAHHFIISFEVFVASTNGNKNIYKCKSWKILSLDELEVDVKYEFNANNKRMYNPKLVLADGAV